MRYFLLTSLLVASFEHALAETIPPVPVSVIVPTSIKRQVGFFAWLNADCTPNGDTESRLAKQPANGTVELDDGSGYTTFPQSNPLYHCNTRPVTGVRVFYTSKDGFVGKDHFESEFFTSTGQDVIWKYAVTVK